MKVPMMAHAGVYNDGHGTIVSGKKLLMRRLQEIREREILVGKELGGYRK